MLIVTLTFCNVVCPILVWLSVLYFSSKRRKLEEQGKKIEPTAAETQQAEVALVFLSEVEQNDRYDIVREATKIVNTYLERAKQ